MEILLAHMFGDYVLQNRWMALNKTSNNTVCVLHCMIYTIMCKLFLFNYLTLFELCIIFTTHFLMDRFRLAKYWRQFYSGETDLPWMILTDNTVHLLILWILIR